MFSKFSGFTKKLSMYFILFLSFFILITLGIYFLQNKLIFFPEVLNQDYQFEFEQEFEEVFYYSPDGEKINALHFKSEDSKGIVFYSHGNAGSLRTWGLVADFFLSNNYDLLIYDYRGYGKSSGVITEAMLYADANMIYKELTKSYLESQIVVYGRSIGTGVATNVAKNQNPKHLILESPYYNLPDLVNKLLPIIPSFLVKYDLANNEMLQNVACPISIFHGTFDEVIYFGSSQKLEKLLKEGDEFIPIVGGHHNDLANFEVYHQDLAKVLE